MLSHSSVIIALEEVETSRLIGFSRVLSDGCYKALIFDVIVAEDQRATGLGRRLVDLIFAHLLNRDVHHKELYCLPELVPYYRAWEFADSLAPLTLMRSERAG